MEGLMVLAIHLLKLAADNPYDVLLISIVVIIGGAGLAAGVIAITEIMFELLTEEDED